MAKAKGKNARPAAKNRPAKSAAPNIKEPGTGQASRPSAKDAIARAVAKPQAKKTENAKPAAKPAAASSSSTSGSSTSGSSTSGSSTSGSSSARPRPAPTKRTTPPASARYTPPIPRAEKVSPLWVPILMFTCLGVGMLTIILNYVNVLPGPDPSNVYLMIGLALITVGFVTATKYH